MGLGKGGRTSIEKRVQKGKEGEGEVEFSQPDMVRAGLQRSGEGCVWERREGGAGALGKPTAWVGSLRP